MGAGEVTLCVGSFLWEDLCTKQICNNHLCVALFVGRVVWEDLCTFANNQQQQLKKLGIIIYYLDQFNHNRSLHTPRAQGQTALQSEPRVDWEIVHSVLTTVPRMFQVGRASKFGGSQAQIESRHAGQTSVHCAPAAGKHLKRAAMFYTALMMAG